MTYLEGTHAPFKTAADRKKLIGYNIRYLRRCDIDRSGRGYFFPRFDHVVNASGVQIILESGNSIDRGDLVELVVVSRYEKPKPEREPDGHFPNFMTWVNKAASWIGGTNPACWDAKGRRCRIGADFMRADEEGTFPVSYWHGEGDQTPAQQRKSQRTLAQRKRNGWA